MTLKERMDEHWRSMKMHSEVHINWFAPLKSCVDHRGRLLQSKTIDNYRVLKGRAPEPRNTHQKG